MTIVKMIKGTIGNLDRLRLQSPGVNSGAVVYITYEGDAEPKDYWEKLHCIPIYYIQKIYLDAMVLSVPLPVLPSVSSSGIR